MIYESNLWDRDVTSVRDGEVLNETGHPIPLRALLHYRWGWPRGAAYKAADWLRDRARESNDVATVWIAKEQRLNQQRLLLKFVPGLQDVLLEGLAAGSAHRLSVAHIIVDDIFDQDGLVSSIVKSVADCMDCDASEINAVTKVVKGPHTKVIIRTGELDA